MTANIHPIYTPIDQPVLVSGAKPEIRVIKCQAMECITGLSCTEIYCRIAADSFPKQVTLGPKFAMWVEAKINRFEAPKWVGDTYLNSIIPVLENRYGMISEHLPGKSPNNCGVLCDWKRYRLLKSSHDQVEKLLTLMLNRAAKRQKVAA